MHVDTNAAIFSSDLNLGGVMLRDVDPAYQWPSFIMMDEPHHAPQRKTVSPMFTPTHLDELAILVRERSAEVLDNLRAATLFDFPWEDRRKLTRWSDLGTALPKSMIYDSEQQRLAELGECATLSIRLVKCLPPARKEMRR
jgi:hypothetical protein